MIFWAKKSCSNAPLPLGYAIRGNNFVCKLNWSIYGLRQLFWQWFKKLSSTTTTNEFQDLRLIPHCFTLEVVIYFCHYQCMLMALKYPQRFYYYYSSASNFIVALQVEGFGQYEILPKNGDCSIQARNLSFSQKLYSFFARGHQVTNCKLALLVWILT